MAEYIDRKSLGISKCNPDVFKDRAYAEGWNAVIGLIENAPAADVVEVVRCKDCKYYVANYCTRDIRGRTNMFYMSDNDFCSYGAKKDGEENGL